MTLASTFLSCTVCADFLMLTSLNELGGYFIPSSHFSFWMSFASIRIIAFIYLVEIARELILA